MTTWFGSDIHFNHDKVIEFCNRPFKDLKEMNSYFLDSFFSWTKPGDDIWLLGDIVFYDHSGVLEAIKILSETGRHFHLIAGNHDDKKTRKHSCWSSVRDYYDLKIDNYRIALCHYPIEAWRKGGKGGLHFHGHTHGNISNEVTIKPNRLDVGYDNTKSALITLDQAIHKLNLQETRLNVRE
jgi:calcineurin-like phosphoesterase family protein